MNQVLTLISNTQDAAVSNKIKDKYVSLLNASHCNWLNRNIALDIYFDDEAPGEILHMLEAENLDYAFQDPLTRSKKLLIADMDSTIINVECLDEIADFLGIKGKVSPITEAAMRGEINFEDALNERVSLLKGLNIANLQTIFNERVKLNPGAITMVRTMNANGANTVLISGGFTYFTERVSKATGFKANYANILLHKNGELTGKVKKPIVDANTKIETLRQFQKKGNLKNCETIAIGDGANDIPMLLGAGIGVGYYPYPATAQASDVKIKHGDLTALLYLQGYTLSDFVDS
ncbi:MAG: phosphoserine phosphatase SerB [Kordiimonadaceae bacterium]|jgi:phosphoserine phosphatase|nr:phosphoserine phosphatase SerB [Kordiimonadaceae bacterium]MBT6467715.1 phosphoserine phosphatase SerB [Kordiimonadaceae bacterium]MBT7605997.1 phosphoserine phosphatase SerB [Kordiimonadaceae bacterium]|tara:strand:- start:28584 stop:29459 length:876 start_codon:yes stop_codon:yes gene_type:complete